MATSRLLISGGAVISMDPKIGDFVNADVLVVDGKIAEIGPNLEVGDAETFDASECIVMPGLIDTHRHTWQAPWRNIGGDWTLFHYLKGLHTGLSKHYRPEDTYAGNLLGTLEALDSGITTLLDWSHNLRTPQHADAAVEGLRDSGARTVFAHGGGADQWGVVPGNTNPHPQDARRVRDQYFSSNDGLMTMSLALRGPQFTTDEVSELDWQLARELDLPITVHVGDGELGKTRPIEWLNSRGLLDQTTTFVHCNTLGDDELVLIADSGGTASVSAAVEMQMGHGWPATGRLLDHGIRPSLSIDVCSAIGGDMFSAMRATLLSQRAIDNAAVEAAGASLINEDLRLACRDVLEFATIEGARAVGLDHKTGSLTPGKDADVIILRTDSLAMTPLNNPIAAVVYNAHGGMVDSILVAGEFVKRDGVLVNADVDKVRQLANDTRDYLLQQALGDEGIADISLDGSWRPKWA